MSKAQAGEFELLRALLDQLPEMIVYWDAEQRCRLANAAYLAFFGVPLEAALGRAAKDFLGAYYPPALPDILSALEGNERRVETEIPGPKGGPPAFVEALYAPHRIDGEVRGFFLLVHDVTARKRGEEAQDALERKVQAEQRLRGLTTLAAGLAHELNNPLATASGALELLLAELDRQPSERPEQRALVQLALEAARRMAQITQGMKLLARTDGGLTERVDLAALLEECLRQCAPVHQALVVVQRELEPACLVSGNRAQLTQSFVHLLENAAHSFPQRPVSENRLRVSVRLAAPSVLIEIEDNGIGIAEEIRERIFEPFFSTRGVGGGLGLGLPVALAVVQAHGGELTFESVAGQGSVFRVRLPLRTEVAREEAPQPSAPRRARVLVIDDERALTKILLRSLSRDFEVEAVNAGVEAIARLQAPAEYAVVLCDLMMPEVTGLEVFEQVTTLRPELAERFIFMTGGVFNEQVRLFLDRHARPVVDKPFNIAALMLQVAAMAARSMR